MIGEESKLDIIGKGAFRIHPAAGGRTGMTMAFAALGLGLVLHAFCSRSEKPLVIAGIFRNYRLLLSVVLTAAVIVLMIAVPYAASLLGLAALSGWEWGALSVLLLIQLVVWEYPKIYARVKF